MKNQIIKQSSRAGLVAGLILGAVATGGIIYVYLKKKKSLAQAAAYKKEHAKDYLKEKTRPLKKHKTDINDLGSFALI